MTRRTVRTLPVIAALLAKPFTGKCCYCCFAGETIYWQVLLLLLYWLNPLLASAAIAALLASSIRRSPMCFVVPPRYARIYALTRERNEQHWHSCGWRKKVARIIASATT